MSAPTTPLKERLRADLTSSIKARDKVRSGTIRMVLSAISEAEVAGAEAIELSDQQVLPAEGEEARLLQLLELLRERRSMLVLDNLETILEAGAAEMGFSMVMRMMTGGGGNAGGAFVAPLQFGTKDEHVTNEAATVQAEAAKEPKTVKIYQNAGHELIYQARVDRLAWIREQFKIK